MGGRPPLYAQALSIRCHSTVLGCSRVSQSLWLHCAAAVCMEGHTDSSSMKGSENSSHRGIWQPAAVKGRVRAAERKAEAMQRVMPMDAGNGHRAQKY